QRLGFLRGQDETHAEDNGPLERLALVWFQAIGCATDRSGRGEKSSDAARGLLIQHKRTSPTSSANPNMGHFKVGCARPGTTWHSPDDGATRLFKLLKPRGSGIPL